MIEIDVGSPVPPYEQLRSQLAQRINDRTLAVGTRLPTVRQFAADLGLAANTVARAYRELEENGLVDTRGRAGTFVTAAGEHSRRRAQLAADEYASTALGLGLDVDEAMRIVHAALSSARPGDAAARPADRSG